MVMPTPLTTSVPVPTPSTDWPGNLRDVIDTQQQTIKFLLGQWDQMLEQAGVSGSFGDPVVFAVDALVPAGWWQTISPTTGGTTIGTVTIGATPTNIFSGVFWSDGNVKVSITGGITAARVGMFAPAP